MEDNVNSVSQQETFDTGTELDPIEALIEIKQNSVPRSEYEKVVAERNKIFKSYANGERAEQPEENKPVDVAQLRSELRNNELSNLEFATKALQLRDELIARGERDPFLPYGKDCYPTDDDYSSAEQVAEALRSCIEYADGDSAIFTNELQRITVDTAPVRRKY